MDQIWYKAAGVVIKKLHNKEYKQVKHRALSRVLALFVSCIKNRIF